MSRNVPIPFFPSPPQEYSQQYFSQLVRNFSVFAEQSRVPGPLRATSLTLTTDTGNVDTGILTYNAAEDTLDLQHLNGVSQQIGFETFMRATNDTGVTIPNGTVVGFAGVNGEIKVAPYIADGSLPEVYFVGLTTFDMVDGATGPITIYGKVREVDTTGPGAETWVTGDILYASPSVSGQLTKVRPTAPNAVIVVAAVLAVDATGGEILVRPTLPIGLDYGTFDSTVNQTVSAINTATPITLTNTLVSNGIVRGTPTSRLVVRESGFYQMDLSLQLSSTSASAKTGFLWIRKNGVDVPNTTRAVTSTINNGQVPLAVTHTVSLNADDYVEAYWASTSTDLALGAVTGLSFAPDTPSVLISLVQIQL